MTPPILKVCGLTRPEDARTSVNAGASAVGMIFYPKSPRAVTVEQASAVAEAIGDGAVKVGVFVNEPSGRIREIVAAVGLDIVQLHGDETPKDCLALDGLRLWRALRVGEDFRPEEVQLYPVEAVLLDADAGAAYGGAGTTFPWEIAAAAGAYKKIIVAGGLEGSNVAEAIRAARPWGVDSNSKLESSPGVKDAAKVRSYLEAAKSVK